MEGDPERSTRQQSDVPFNAGRMSEKELLQLRTTLPFRNSQQPGSTRRKSSAGAVAAPASTPPLASSSSSLLTSLASVFLACTDPASPVTAPSPTTADGTPSSSPPPPLKTDFFTGVNHFFAGLFHGEGGGAGGKEKQPSTVALSQGSGTSSYGIGDGAKASHTASHSGDILSRVSPPLSASSAPSSSVAMGVAAVPTHPSSSVGTCASPPATPHQLWEQEREAVQERCRQELIQTYQRLLLPPFLLAAIEASASSGAREDEEKKEKDQSKRPAPSSTSSSLEMSRRFTPSTPTFFSSTSVSTPDTTGSAGTHGIKHPPLHPEVESTTRHSTTVFHDLKYAPPTSTTTVKEEEGLKTKRERTRPILPVMSSSPSFSSPLQTTTENEDATRSLETMRQETLPQKKSSTRKTVVTPMHEVGSPSLKRSLRVSASTPPPPPRRVNLSELRECSWCKGCPDAYRAAVWRILTGYYAPAMQSKGMLAFLPPELFDRSLLTHVLPPSTPTTSPTTSVVPSGVSSPASPCTSLFFSSTLYAMWNPPAEVRRKRQEYRSIVSSFFVDPTAMRHRLAADGVPYSPAFPFRSPAVYGSAGSPGVGGYRSPSRYGLGALLSPPPTEDPRDQGDKGTGWRRMEHHVNPNTLPVLPVALSYSEPSTGEACALLGSSPPALADFSLPAPSRRSSVSSGDSFSSAVSSSSSSSSSFSSALLHSSSSSFSYEEDDETYTSSSKERMNAKGGGASLAPLPKKNSEETPMKARRASRTSSHLQIQTTFSPSVSKMASPTAWSTPSANGETSTRPTNTHCDGEGRDGGRKGHCLTPTLTPVHAPFRSPYAVVLRNGGDPQSREGKMLQQIWKDLMRSTFGRTSRCRSRPAIPTTDKTSSSAPPASRTGASFRGEKETSVVSSPSTSISAFVSTAVGTTAVKERGEAKTKAPGASEENNTSEDVIPTTIPLPQTKQEEKEWVLSSSSLCIPATITKERPMTPSSTGITSLSMGEDIPHTPKEESKRKATAKAEEEVQSTECMHHHTGASVSTAEEGAALPLEVDEEQGTSSLSSPHMEDDGGTTYATLQQFAFPSSPSLPPPSSSSSSSFPSTHEEARLSFTSGNDTPAVCVPRNRKNTIVLQEVQQRNGENVEEETKKEDKNLRARRPHGDAEVFSSDSILEDSTSTTTTTTTTLSVGSPMQEGMSPFSSPSLPPMSSRRLTMAGVNVATSTSPSAKEPLACGGRPEGAAGPWIHEQGAMACPVPCSTTPNPPSSGSSSSLPSHFLRHPRVLAMLERVLLCWGMRHPASGYWQGMHDLITPFVAVLLAQYSCPTSGSVNTLLQLSPSELDAALSVEAIPESVWTGALEPDAYWLSSYILDLVQGHFTQQQQGFFEMIHQFDDLIQRADPLLHQHLSSLGIEASQYAYRWMACLLSRELQPWQILRLFDAYLSLQEITVGGESGEHAGTGVEDLAHHRGRPQDETEGEVGKRGGRGREKQTPNNATRLASPVEGYRRRTGGGISNGGGPGTSSFSSSSTKAGTASGTAVLHTNEPFDMGKRQHCLDIHIYVCAAFLLTFSRKLLSMMDFGEVLSFLQELPSEEITPDGMDELIAQAFLLKSLLGTEPPNRT